MAPVFRLLAGVVLLREQPGWKVTETAPLTVSGMRLAQCRGGELAADRGSRRAPYFQRPSSLRRTAARLSHCAPSVGLSSLGQASMQLAIT